MGGRCIFVGAVGDDAFGQVVLDRLIEHGVDTSLIKVVKGVPDRHGLRQLQRRRQPRLCLQHRPFGGCAVRRRRGDDRGALAAFGLDIMHVSGSALGDAGMGAKVLRALQGVAREGRQDFVRPQRPQGTDRQPGLFRVRARDDRDLLRVPAERRRRRDALSRAGPAQLRIGILCPRRRLCRPQEGREAAAKA